MAFDFPSNPVNGEIWTDTLTGKQYMWNGFAWSKGYSEPPAGIAHPPAETIPVEPPIDGATSVDAVLRNLSVEVDQLTQDSGQKVAKAGNTEGIMTGFLTLNADPVDPLHAVPKQYVDARASLPTGGVTGMVLAINAAGLPQWGAAADGGNF
jgi:hypothetical protein